VPALLVVPAPPVVPALPIVPALPVGPLLLELEQPRPISGKQMNAANNGNERCMKHS
jgi:hypothetical protein